MRLRTAALMVCLLVLCSFPLVAQDRVAWDTQDSVAKAMTWSYRLLLGGTDTGTLVPVCVAVASNAICDAALPGTQAPGTYQVGVRAIGNGITTDFTGSPAAWTVAGTPPPQPMPSPNCTEATGTQTITDSANATWSISPTGNRILRNGAQAGNGLGTRILWSNGVIYVLGTDNAYWRWNGNLSTGTPATWTSVGTTKPACGTAPPPACTYATPAALNVPATGGPVGLNVTTQTGCAWTASSGSNWMALSTSSGTGTGAITVTVQANPTTASRTATVTVVGTTATRATTVTQPGGTVQPPPVVETCTDVTTRVRTSGTTVTVEPSTSRICP